VNNCETAKMSSTTPRRVGITKRTLLTIYVPKPICLPSLNKSGRDIYNVVDSRWLLTIFDVESMFGTVEKGTRTLFHNG
jgi:hypothetical protein